MTKQEILLFVRLARQGIRIAPDTHDLLYKAGLSVETVTLLYDAYDKLGAVLVSAGEDA